MRRFLATVSLATVLALGALAGAAAPPAAAQSDGQVTTTAPARGGDIIPKPGQGSEPEDAGDRGGELQTVLFVVIIGGIAVMGAVIVRQSRKARAGRGF